MLRMFRLIVSFICLLPSLSLFASEGQKPSYPSFDYETARNHEIKPHRRTIPVDGKDEGSDQLQLKLTVSPAGDVAHAEAIGEDEETRLWLQLEGEVYQWRFTPFKKNGKIVTAEVDERIDLVPPERLPKTHVPPPAITKDSKIAITLLQWTCDGSCPLHSVTVSTDGIVFEGFNVAARGRHTDKIDNDAVIALAKRLVAADFYSMEGDYRYRGWTTLSSSLSIKIDGHTKSVRDYEGRWVGMPSVIVELEDEVDAVARTERWIEGGDGLVAALRAEKFDFASYDAQVILNEAAARGQTATVRELLAAGVPLKPLPAPKIDNPYGGPFGEVQLLTAASGHPDTLQVFLDAAASKDDQGKTALFAAGEETNSGEDGESVECVRVLAKAGAKVDARDKDGNTLLHKTYLIDVLEELLKLGADVNARNHDGETPIFTTMNIKAILLFLQDGADLTIRNNRGETVMDGNTGRGPLWDEALRKALAEIE